MGLKHWVNKMPSRMRNDGFREGTRKSVLELNRFAQIKIDELDLRGERIYDRDWDVLIVLDACRTDVLRNQIGNYDFLTTETVSSFESKASCSRLWMDRNFTPDYRREMRETVHITGNPYSDTHLDANDFAELDEVWKYDWDDEQGTVLARSITDRAIHAGREYEYDRMIVHYMQPHFPSVPEPLGSGIDIETFGEGWKSVWGRLRDGDLDRQTVWDSYEANLRYVLEDVELLLENLDAESVVVTADHGNAFGEDGLYGHPPNRPHPVLRRVPWVETSGVDHGTYSPKGGKETVDTTDEDVKARLELLGYR